MNARPRRGALALALSLALALTLTAACGKTEEPAPTAPPAAPAPAPPAPTAPAAPPEPAPASVAAACPADRVVTVDLDGIVKRFGATGFLATDEEYESPVASARIPRYEADLAALGLPALAETTRPAEGMVGRDVFVCRVAVQRARFDADADDALVVVTCHDDERDLEQARYADGAVVLRARPDAPGTWCRIGALEHTWGVTERPCLTEVADDTPTYDYALVDLVAPERDALRVTHWGGSCGSGSERGDDVTVAFFGVEGGALVEYATIATATASYTSPCPPASGLSATVALEGGFPKTIVARWKRVCGAEPEGPDDPCEADPGCVPAEGVRRWRYADGAYADDEGAVEPDVAALVKEARAVAAAAPKRAASLLRAAYDRAPDTPGVRGELGWALFGAGDLPAARAMSEEALAHAASAKARGAILYNLGRIDEAEAKRDDAIAHYRASLAARPSEAAAKRLKGLGVAP
ncbi:MAG: tetratricopeptide repeat protein [Deltaproteobacteria bacterium]|nr:tetratricopeptide repeat protein [Deltaproteobacteria bacterium]